MFIILSSLLLCFLSTLAITRYLRKEFKKKGITGKDVHKKELPEIPERGGLGILVGLSIGCIIEYLLTREGILLLFLLTVILGGVIGLLDDITDLDVNTKILLGLIPGVPLACSSMIHPRPIFPFIGPTRLTIAYPLFVPFYFTILINAFNMIDTLNGLLPLTGSIISTFILVSSHILGFNRIDHLTLIFLSSLSAYYYFNRFPATIFSGNVGSMLVGSGVAFLSLAGRVEASSVISILPLILNSFSTISSIGAKTRNQIKVRPVIVKNGLIYANIDAKSPLTLISLLTFNDPKTEKRLILEITALTAFSGLLSIVTTYFFMR